MQQSSFDWKDVFDKTLEVCQADENYSGYSAREKMLAFVFTLLEQLNNREDAVPVLKRYIPLVDNTLDPLKKLVCGYCDSLIFEGTNSGEIQARPFIANYYRNALWAAVASILNFWVNDASEQKENTDVFVEKTIYFTFDLLAPNAIDSGIDLIRNFFKLRS
jgi:hypothetical protein